MAVKSVCWNKGM